MKKINKITFLGNFLAPFSSENYYLKTFRKMGLEVITFQEGPAPVDIEAVRKSALESDLFFWVHTHDWKNPLGDARLLQELKDRGIPSMGYHLDLWIGIERQKDLETDPYWGIQYFFSVDPEMVDLLNSTPGKPKTFYMPPGVFEDECYMAQPNHERFPHEIVFTGSYGYHHEWQWRPQLIDWLKNTYGDRFGHYSGEPFSISKQRLNGADLNELYANAKIVIGDTLCPGFTKPGYFSDRLFEVTGRGGFMIFPYIKGLEDCFVLDNPILNKEENNSKQVELVTFPFGDLDQLKEKIDFYLEMTDIREEIKKAGFERTKREHTYTQRLSKILEIIKNE